PLSIDSFEEIIEDNYIYVDKTKEIWKIIEKRKKYHFLSRPRRFGKSLLISTMKELFLGNEKLFKNLYIHDKWDWNKVYPVLHFDMSKHDSTSPKNLEKSIIHSIEKIANKKQINIDKEISLKDKFIDLIEGIYESTGEKLVVLIDEYDKPILDNIGNLKIANENREVLKSFYTILKSSGQYIHFVFITGVSKFSQTSIFSGPNVLKDLTFNENYSKICGYSQVELLNYFNKHFDNFAKSAKMTMDNLLKKIKSYYDGYSWDGKNFLYNPYSILSSLDDKLFSNYWFKTGTPSFLIELIRKENDISSLITKLKIDPDSLTDFELDNINLTSALLQSGYLTIKDKIEHEGEILEYILDIPNKEVHDSIFKELASIYTSKSYSELKILAHDLLSSFKTSDSEKFNKVMRILISRISYLDHKRDESFYHAIFLSIMGLLGFSIRGEIITNIGRFDAGLIHENMAVICEIKYNDKENLDKLTDIAMNQIIKKRYYESYLDKDIVILLGLGFSNRDVKGKLKPLNKENI
ncbi:MAG: ATP-binding protein, partial [Methanobrevibacter sp.]|nr:ATP-binding protein [Methanobrevibacter sp.]